MDEISQTEMYTAGTYRDRSSPPSRARRDRDGDGALPHQGATDPRQTPCRRRGRRSADRRLARFPYKPYCRGCGRDTITLTSYDDATTDLAYTCDVCGDPTSPT